MLSKLKLEVNDNFMTMLFSYHVQFVFGNKIWGQYPSIVEFDYEANPQPNGILQSKLLLGVALFQLVERKEKLGRNPAIQTSDISLVMASV